MSRGWHLEQNASQIQFESKWKLYSKIVVCKIQFSHTETKSLDEVWVKVIWLDSTRFIWLGEAWRSGFARGIGRPNTNCWWSRWPSKSRDALARPNRKLSTTRQTFSCRRMFPTWKTWTKMINYPVTCRPSVVPRSANRSIAFEFICKPKSVAEMFENRDIVNNRLMNWKVY